MAVKKITNVERAKQFMPFASLRGYGKIVAETERIKSPKITLSENDEFALNNSLIALKKGDLVLVKYYEVDCYIEEECVVSEINFAYQYVKLVKKVVKFSDLYSIRKRQ